MTDSPGTETQSSAGSRCVDVFSAFSRLGWTSFGGPVAHIGFFRNEFVTRRRWMNERAFADLLALCQFLPGPASSQVGIGIGLYRAGLPGAVLAWTAFTLPSALILVLAGFGIREWEGMAGTGLVHGLKVAAVAVVAQAVTGMARTLCPDLPRIMLAVSAATLLIVWQAPVAQLAVILAGGLVGWILLKPAEGVAADHMKIPVSRRMAGFCLALFFVLLFGLPVAAGSVSHHGLDLIERFYRAGSLVFGGGHVVLPLLQSQVVPPGWVTKDLFLAGYGAAQAVPGPLFTFAAYLGTVMTPQPNGIAGALICLVAIFAPSFLLVIGALPFWESLRRVRAVQSALMGVNAVVVGLLAAAFIDPVWTGAIFTATDFALAAAALALLMWVKWPPWGVVLLTAAGGMALAAV